jgi:hypothetical protein
VAEVAAAVEVEVAAWWWWLLLLLLMMLLLLLLWDPWPWEECTAVCGAWEWGSLIDAAVMLFDVTARDDTPAAKPAPSWSLTLPRVRPPRYSSAAASTQQPPHAKSKALGSCSS